MSAQSMSPPTSGASVQRSTAPICGRSRQVVSQCQAFSYCSARVSGPLSMRTSPGWSRSLAITGWSSSSPKRRANATCSARVMSCPLRNSTLCASSSERTSAKSSSSRDASPSEMPDSSAPIVQVSRSTLIESLVGSPLMASGRFAQVALEPRPGIGRETVLRQRLLDAVVEHADLADLARLLSGGDLAAEFARQAHQLLDLLHGAHLGLAVLRPEVVLDAAAHMQAHRHAHHVDRQHVAHAALDGQHRA